MDLHLLCPPSHLTAVPPNARAIFFHKCTRIDPNNPNRFPILFYLSKIIITGQYLNCFDYFELFCVSF